MSTIRLTAFKWVPPVAQGLVRDLRVRWALGEAGLDYEEHLIGAEDQDTASHRRMQPFGQIPVLEQDGLVLFESGAIVMHIAEQSAALMPASAGQRARTRVWMLAALNTIEPPILALNALGMKAATSDGVAPARDKVVELVRKRLQSLSNVLEDKEHLEGAFSAADLLMTTVLRIPRETDLVTSLPVLDAYRLRCEARPAFQQALAAQMKAFAENAPAGH
jgi:glutathione S-transferase